MSDLNHSQTFRVRQRGLDMHHFVFQVVRVGLYFYHRWKTIVSLIESCICNQTQLCYMYQRERYVHMLPCVNHALCNLFMSLICIYIGLRACISLAAVSCCSPLIPSWCCPLLFYCLPPTQSTLPFVFILSVHHLQSVKASLTYRLHVTHPSLQPDTTEGKHGDIQ